MVMLIGLALVMLGESLWGLHGAKPLFDNLPTQIVVGVIAGLGLGVVTALLGLAGGELLISTIVLLFGVDIVEKVKPCLIFGVEFNQTF